MLCAPRAPQPACLAPRVLLPRLRSPRPCRLRAPRACCTPSPPAQRRVVAWLAVLRPCVATQSSSLTASVTIHYSVSRYAPQPSQLPQSRNKFCIVTLLSSQTKSACCNTIHCIAIQLPSNPKSLCQDTINCIVTPATQLFCLNTTTVLCPSLQYTLTYCNTILSSLLHSLLHYNATL